MMPFSKLMTDATRLGRRLLDRHPGLKIAIGWLAVAQLAIGYVAGALGNFGELRKTLADHYGISGLTVIHFVVGALVIVVFVFGYPRHPPAGHVREAAPPGGCTCRRRRISSAQTSAPDQ
jgi:hypothetical protein